MNSEVKSGKKAKNYQQRSRRKASDLPGGLWAAGRRTPSPSGTAGCTRRTGAPGPRSTCGAAPPSCCSIYYRSSSRSADSGAAGTKRTRSDGSAQGLLGGGGGAQTGCYDRKENIRRGSSRSCSCSLRQYGPFSWWSRTWSHTAYIWDTGDRRRKTGCYTTKLQIDSHPGRRLFQELKLKAWDSLWLISSQPYLILLLQMRND